MTHPERQFTTNDEAYEIFVGSLTPQEFIAGYDTPELAVDQYLDHGYPHEEKPTWLRKALIEYLNSQPTDRN